MWTKITKYNSVVKEMDRKEQDFEDCIFLCHSTNTSPIFAATANATDPTEDVVGIALSNPDFSILVSALLFKRLN